MEIEKRKMSHDHYDQKPKPNINPDKGILAVFDQILSEPHPNSVAHGFASGQLLFSRNDKVK